MLLNLVDENISFEGRKVILVPVFLDFPICFNGALGSPFLNSTKYFFPSLFISNSSFSDSALTTETPTHAVHQKLYMSHDQTYHQHEVVS